MKAYVATIVFLITSFALPLHAQAPEMSPHEAKRGKTGVLVGTVIKGKSVPLGEQSVALEIFHRGRPVLTIPKRTGADGSYQFKNIFRNPDFSYVISTSYNGTTHRTKPASLGMDEDSITLNLDVSATPSTPTTPATPSAVAKPPHGKYLMRKKGGWPFTGYQTLAIILSIIAIGGAVYVVRKRKRPSDY